jgi:hypothetical protein
MPGTFNYDYQYLEFWGLQVDLRMALKRIAAFVIGAGLLTVVVWLGVKTTSGPVYIVWFGLASAILAPTGIATIGYALTGGQREVLQRRSKVPEIDKLISEANTQEERIRLLEEERSHLLEAVQLETRRQTLVTKKATLEQDGAQILNELQAVERELSHLEMDIEASTVREEIERLNERLAARQGGDMIIRLGETYVSVSRNLVRGFPLSAFLLLPGTLAEGILRSLESLSPVMLRSAGNLSSMFSQWGRCWAGRRTMSAEDSASSSIESSIVNMVPRMLCEATVALLPFHCSPLRCSAP